MKSYDVRITDKALQDMQRIYEYIATVFKEPDIAMKQYDRIANAIESLNIFPERCKLFNSQPECNLGMRQILIDNYSAIYVIDNDSVIVLRVLHSSSDINMCLSE